MGWKGPAVILVFGVFGLGALAMFANMLTQTPEAQVLLKLRAELDAHAPVESSSLATVEDEHELELYVKPGQFREPAAGQLPAGFEKVPSIYRRHRPATGRGRYLRLKLLEGEPDSARVLWSQRLDLHEHDGRIQKQLSELLGQKVKINQRRSDGQMGLAVGLRSRVDPQVLDQAAGILANYRYGGWAKLSFNTAGTWVYFDGAGKRLRSAPGDAADPARKPPAPGNGKQ